MMATRVSTRRAVRAAAAVTVVGVALGGCALRGAGARARVGDAEYIMRFSHVTTARTPKGAAAEKFADLVKEKSGGRIVVEVFPNSELYGDKDELQALQSNSVQVLAPASAKFTTVAPKLQVLDLPFLFDSVDEIPEVAAPQTRVGKAIYDNPDLAARNMIVLGLWDSGMKHLTSNSPLATPGDLAGRSFRIQPSDVLKDQFNKWRAHPTPLAFAEVYSAMQQGLIDGGENTWTNIFSQKMHTVQKYVAETDHGYSGYVLVMNKQFFNDLPEDLQSVVREAADEASVFNRKESVVANEQAKQDIIAAGTSEFHKWTPEEREKFKTLVVPGVWDDFRDLIGADIIDELKARG